MLTLLVSVGTMFVGCSDELFDESEGKQSFIRFNVSTTQMEESRGCSRSIASGTRDNAVLAAEGKLEEKPLQRFLVGHIGLIPDCSDYETALAEICRGLKSTHWMWYVFPEIRGLTADTVTEYFALDGLSEAKAFYEHPILGQRLREITSALLELDKDDPVSIFGTIDAYKLRHCMTLFDALYPDDSIFGQVLDKYCLGIRDEETLSLL